MNVITLDGSGNRGPRIAKLFKFSEISVTQRRTKSKANMLIHVDPIANLQKKEAFYLFGGAI